jgi:2-polyprenyl-6-hydroxyphenyl methylase / 3-demethylubiquinone-9 3-methyltransferase
MKYTRFTENRTLEEGRQIFESRVNDAKIIYEKFGSSFFYRLCPICGEDDYIHLEKFINLYEICQCKFCNSEYVNPVPNIEALSYYYNVCENNRLFAELNIKRQNKDFRVDSRVDFLKGFLEKIISRKKYEKIKILEIGCNNGTFLSSLKKFISSINAESIVDLYGIDIDQKLIKDNYDDSINLHVLPAERLQELNVKFDMILHFELIEHLQDPVAFAKSIYQNLVKGGLTIFTTPNSLGLEVKSVGYNKTRLLAHSIFPPMHLNAFNTQNILLFANLNNFKLRSIDTPGRLDMDLISQVSEELKDDNLKKITLYDEETKAYFQYLLSYLNSSSHMRVVLEK